MNYEKAGKYDEAARVQGELEEFQQHDVNRRCVEYRSQLDAERSGMDDQHLKKLADLSAIWDRRMAEFEAHASGLQNTLAEKHREEHNAYFERIQRETEPRTVKWSAELLNLRKIEDALVKQKNYAEARDLKNRLVQMEAKEHALWKAKRDVKNASLDHQFLQKQQLEMGGLLKRIKAGREEQRLSKEHEMERLLQHYQNTKTHFDTRLKINQGQTMKQLASLSSPRRHASPQRVQSPARKQSPLR